MNTLKRSYTPPKMDVSEVELESTICSGSVFSPETQDKIEIQSQGFANDGDWADKGDFSDIKGWTPSDQQTI